MIGKLGRSACNRLTDVKFTIPLRVMAAAGYEVVS